MSKRYVSYSMETMTQRLGAKMLMSNLPRIIVFNKHIRTAARPRFFDSVNSPFPAECIGAYRNRIGLNGPLYVGDCIGFVSDLIKGTLNSALNFFYTRKRSVGEPVGCIVGNKRFDVRPYVAVVCLFVGFNKFSEVILVRSHVVIIAWLEALNRKVWLFYLLSKKTAKNITPFEGLYYGIISWLAIIAQVKHLLISSPQMAGYVS